MNMAALNRCFLRAVANAQTEEFGVLSGRAMSLDQQSRLASAPFLLFSLREHDEDFWRMLLDENPQLGFDDQPDPPDAAICRLQAAALAFLWQLARRNPYAVRLICGASVSWCERLAEQALVTLLGRSADRHDLLGLRFANDDTLWRRLLENGAAKSNKLRRTSHHGALQQMLTHRHAPKSARLSAAACITRTPAKQSARYEARGIREPKV